MSSEALTEPVPALSRPPPILLHKHQQVKSSPDPLSVAMAHASWFPTSSQLSSSDERPRPPPAPAALSEDAREAMELSMECLMRCSMVVVVFHQSSWGERLLSKLYVFGVQFVPVPVL